MQRAARGADVVDRRPVGLLRPAAAVSTTGTAIDRQRAARRPPPSGSRLARTAARGRSRGQQTPAREGRQEIDREQRHLVAAQHDAGGDDAGGDAVEDRAPRQRAVEAHQGHRQIGEAQHLADVLDAPGHRCPVAEGQRGDQRARPVPALVAEPQHQGRAAEEHHRQHGGVDGPRAGRRVDERQHQERRREDHRLRVGDLRVAAEDEGRPERRLARRRGSGRETGSAAGNAPWRPRGWSRGPTARASR